MLEPTTIDEVRQAILACPGLIAVGGETKPALSAVPQHFQRLQLGKLSGVVEYEPSEFTITVLAGTPLVEVQRTLDEHGQYLPFDPPLAAAGATIGGTVAAGLNGPGAYRYGPIRDFIIGVRYLDGEGRLICGGGKVVKNAAGFDLPKFLIGSLGRFGVMVELTFKVFPKAETTVTFGLGPRSFQHAREMITELSRGPYDLDALDFAPVEDIVWVRLAGRQDAVEARVRQIGEKVFPNCGIAVCKSAEAAYLWRQQLDFSWAPPEHYLVKVPIALGQMKAVERFCKRSQMPRSYSMGGNVAWLAPATLDDFEWDGLVLRAPAGMEFLDNPLIGDASRNGGEIQRALKLAFDPGGRFPTLSLPSSDQLKSAGPESRRRRESI